MDARPLPIVVLSATLVALAGGAPSAPSGAPAAATPAAAGLPYVYTHWRQITVADGLPNDHIFAVRAAGDSVWVGTEDGLARIDRATGKVVKVWREADGLPFRVITAIDVDPLTGDVWLGLFGGGLARLSGGRFDHWDQLNSGLVNDVVYGVAVVGEDVWTATTAGACRFRVRTGEWTVFNEKNSPMEEIWNYNVSAAGDHVILAVWGSGVLVYDLRRAAGGGNPWEEYLDPDGEMEIDLYRDDGINHVITTGAVEAEGVLWVSTYFGASRYDGRSWRGYAKKEGGLPSDFINNVRARSGREATFCTDRGLAVVADGPGDTWVVYTRNPGGEGGRATVTQGGRVVEVVDTGVNVPHNFTINADLDGNDVWVATAKGLAWGIGDGYYPGLAPRAAGALGPPPAQPARAGAPGR